VVAIVLWGGATINRGVGPAAVQVGGGAQVGAFQVGLEQVGAD
jgi:hypothetical protein